MELIVWIIGIIISGLIIGALGRLAIPGPNPMGIGATILVGIAGALIGGLIAAAIGTGPWVAFILEVLVAAGLVYLLTRSASRGRTRHRTRV